MSPQHPCAICGGPVNHTFVIHQVAIVDCPACGHRQADLTVDASHIDETYGDHYFMGGGAGYEDYDSNALTLVARGAGYGAILAKHAKPATVVDVGAAAGYLVEGMRSVGWTPIGIEPNDMMAAAGRARGLDIRTGSGESLLGGLTAGSIDAVSMIQVIAHLGDPLGMLRAATDALRPAGLLLIETWDRASITARIFGKKWHEYSPPSVVHWFTRNELDAVAAKAGFHRITTGRYPKMITAAHGRQLVEHRMGEGHLVSKLAGRIPAGLKVRYPGNDLFWSLYRRR